MKTFKKSTVKKLVDRFDYELKAILLDDINQMRSAKVELLSEIDLQTAPGTLSVA